MSIPISVLRSAVLALLAFLSGACGEQGEPTGSTKAGGGPGTAAGPRSCILTVGWVEREPFHYRGPDGSPYGTDIEIISALAKTANCALRYRQIERANALDQLADGTIDILLGSRVGNEAGNEESGTATKSYRRERYLLHVPHGQIPAQEDLTMLVQTGYKLAMISGIEYDSTIAELRDNPLYRDQFSESPNTEAAIDRLLRGEVDGIIDDAVAVRAVARRKLVDKNIDTLFITAGDGEVALLLSPAKAPADLVERFNRAIDEALKDGVIKKITERFG